MTPSWSDLFRIFGRIGVLSFGGPAAQIALMHDSLVSRHKLQSEQDFLRALSLCMLLPGPEAMQLATYAGWRLRGVAGGVLAGLLFVVPGACIVLVLAMAYLSYGDLPLVRAAFLGLKAAVIVIVLQALLRLAQKALSGLASWLLATVAFLALFVFGLPFPLIILAAGAYGYVTATPVETAEPQQKAPSGLWRTCAVWSGLWAAPLVLCWFFAHSFLMQIGFFFSKLAVVSFGGAYAVLSYMTQTVVQDFRWITTGQMIDALGLAETTPGPLILVTEFVALLAGFAQGGITTALTAGALTLWVTFIPCFLWIFMAAPYLEHIATRPRLSGALTAITAAIVGVILNLSVWFALHVVFAEIITGATLPMPRPVLASLNLWALALIGLAMILMLWWRLGVLLSLAILAASGAGLGLLGAV